MIARILLTNWIHVIGFFVTTYLSLTFFSLLGIYNNSNQGWFETFLLGLTQVPFLFFTYGLPFLAGFYVAIILLDTVAFNLNSKNLIVKLLIEWMLIVTVFIYWAFEHEYWLWLPLSASLLVTQVIRKKRIEAIIRTCATR